MKNTLLVLFICFQTAAVAQVARQIWTQPVDVGLQWSYVAADGTLLTATPEEVTKDSAIVRLTTLRGIDPLNGNVKWKYTSDPSLISGAAVIPNSTYIKLRTSLLTIIDPKDGRLIIDPELFNQVFNVGFLTEPSRVWVEGMLGNTREFSMIDLETGKRLWSRSDYFDQPKKEERKKYGLDKTVSKVALKVAPPEDKSSPPGLLGTPIIPDNEHMIIVTGDRVNYNDFYKISSIDGDVVWKMAGPPPNKINSLLDVEAHTFQLIADSQKFIFVRDRWSSTYSYENGSQLSEEVKTTSQKSNSLIGVNIKSGEKSETRDGGVLLYSDQNVRFINPDGSTRYSNHYNKVSEFQTEFFKSMMKDGMVVSTGDILVMFTLTDARHTLELINKDSGETISRVNVDPSDTNPVFQIDTTSERLFYFYKNNLTMFDFKK